MGEGGGGNCNGRERNGMKFKSLTSWCLVRVLSNSKVSQYLHGVTFVGSFEQPATIGVTQIES